MTHGGQREGSGRIRIFSAPVRTSVVLDSETFNMLKEAGSGNFSKGVRIAAQLLKEKKRGR